MINAEKILNSNSRKYNDEEVKNIVSLLDMILDELPEMIEQDNFNLSVN